MIIVPIGKLVFLKFLSQKLLGKILFSLLFLIHLRWGTGMAICLGLHTMPKYLHSVQDVRAKLSAILQKCMVFSVILNSHLSL